MREVERFHLSPKNERHSEYPLPAVVTLKPDSLTDAVSIPSLHAIASESQFALPDIPGLENFVSSGRLPSGFKAIDSALLQAITGLSFSLPAIAINYTFDCSVLYSQATNVAGDTVWHWCAYDRADSGERQGSSGSECHCWNHYSGQFEWTGQRGTNSFCDIPARDYRPARSIMGWSCRSARIRTINATILCT
jgi:hypothetical protein